MGFPKYLQVGRICLETTFCFCSCISCISWFKYFSRFIAVGLTKKNGFPLRLSEECCHSFSDVGKFLWFRLVRLGMGDEGGRDKRGHW